MSHQIRGFFKRITGDQVSYNALAKEPISDAEIKLKLFNDATSVSISAIESYLKSLSKLIDQTLSEKFNESKEHFGRYDKPSDQIYGTVLGKLSLIQNEMNNDVIDFIRNVEANVLKPMVDYQEELKVVKENKKELKEAYDKIEQCRQILEKHKKEAESAHRTNKSSDLMKFDDRVLRSEKELDEATAVANEKYDKYTETLYKRIAEECELSNNYVNYLNAQRKYHKRALKKLDLLIPDVDESIHNYYKKPVFGSDLEEYVERSRKPGSSENVSPVIRKLIQGMYMQNALSEEGIFRIAGSRVKMNCLLNAINAGYLDMLDTTNDFDVHCLAGVLKQYIRELPDSLLCNDFYEDWIEAIGTTPLSQKIEAFKEVLDRIPKVNFENIRYLIKFLAKVVENSDKTKMTTSNMGICFGVSLLSNNGPLNNKNMYNKSEAKVIDMATATNVFDFLLTNNDEIFPGEIDFNPNINNNKKTNSGSGSYFTLSKATGSSFSKDLNNESTPQATFNVGSNNSMSNNKYSDSPVFNKQVHSIKENSSITTTNNNNNSNEIINDQNGSQFLKYTNTSSPIIGSNNNNNITNINRNINKSNRNYFDTNVNNNEMFASNNSINSVGSISNVNNLNNNMNKSSSSPSQNSADPGSISPRRERSKKMAPAPPPAPRAIQNPNVTSQSNNDTLEYPTYGIATEIQRSPPKVPTSPPSTSIASSTLVNAASSIAEQINTFNSNEVSKPAPIFPKLSSNQNITPAVNALRISNLDASQIERSPSISPSSASTTSNSKIILEKPNQPPPSVPIRPPPIGFNISTLQVDPSSDSPSLSNTNSKLASNSNSTLLSSSSSSAVSSSSQEMLNSTNNTTTNNNQNNNNNNPVPAKGPKPAVPRRPSNMISAHIKQFDQTFTDANPQNQKQNVEETRNKSIGMCFSPNKQIKSNIHF